jgi:hypothetical protein
MERTSEERRTWNTPVREPWNPVIKHCLNAVDEHMRLYLQTYDPWHLAQAEVLRTYTLELKKWIHFTEGRDRAQAEKVTPVKSA